MEVATGLRYGYKLLKTFLLDLRTVKKGDTENKYYSSMNEQFFVIARASLYYRLIKYFRFTNPYFLKINLKVINLADEI